MSFQLSVHCAAWVQICSWEWYSSTRWGTRRWPLVYRAQFAWSFPNNIYSWVVNVCILLYNSAPAHRLLHVQQLPIIVLKCVSTHHTLLVSHCSFYEGSVTWRMQQSFNFLQGLCCLGLYVVTSRTIMNWMDTSRRLVSEGYYFQELLTT